MTEPANSTSDWAEFHRRSLVRPPRELLRRTLGCFALEKREPGLAVDLGCGAGPESLELLRCGWQVHAYDANEGGLKTLFDSTPSAFRSSLHTHTKSFWEVDFPPCDFLWAGYSLPFCPSEDLSTLWAKIVTALRPNGRFAGDFFGDQHAWAAEAGITTQTEAEVRGMLEGLIVEAFDVENGVRPSGDVLTRWHAFGIAARKIEESAGARDA